MWWTNYFAICTHQFFYLNNLNVWQDDEVELDVYHDSDAIHHKIGSTLVGQDEVDMFPPQVDNMQVCYL